ncbi:MAG: OmpA family protein [Woeseiaceae bacterium]|nr:OmpA family protein [Woeseiaceae bacterium]
MNIRILVGCACVFALAFPALSHADAKEGQHYLSAMLSLYDDDKDRLVDDGISGGKVSLGYVLNENWNIEGVLGFNNPDGFLEQRQTEIGADLQRVFNREGVLTPYLFVGASLLDIDIKDGGDDNGMALGLGGGFLADIFGDSDVSLRAEYRYRADDSSFGDHFVSLGLQMPFGDAPRPMPAPAREPVDPDSDGDGVPDSKDRCKNTPAGVQVDVNGCPRDADGDGVPDHRDNCPNTVRGAAVDANGCELDGDGDGVVDRLDKCPNTRAGAQVDVAGCEIREEIRLPGVNFETNSANLLPSALSVLNDAAETLKRNPSIKVEVAGHTDSDGAAAYNEDLSARRAETVRAFLQSRGVDADRMTSRGYGESDPIADNSTASGKAQNRRVVLRVTER